MSTSDSWFDMKTACGAVAAPSERSIRNGMPQRTRRARDQARAQKRKSPPRGGIHDVRSASVPKTTVAPKMTIQPQTVAARSRSPRDTSPEFTGGGKARPP